MRKSLNIENDYWYSSAYYAFLLYETKRYKESIYYFENFFKYECHKLSYVNKNIYDELEIECRVKYDKAFDSLN